MKAVLMALLLKPFIGIAFIAFLLITARAGAWLLYWVIPCGAVKRELYRKSVTDSLLTPPTLLSGL